MPSKESKDILPAFQKMKYIENMPLWGEFRGLSTEVWLEATGHSFSCASLKQMWNVLNAFSRPSHSWEERWVPAHPIQAVTYGGKWFPQTRSLDSRPPTKNRGKSAPAQPGVRSRAGTFSPFRPLGSGLFCLPSSAPISPAPPLPACVWRAGLPSRPLLLQPACSFSFKEFKGWLPRSVLHAAVCFLYSVLVGSSHGLYIWVPFPVSTFVDGSQGPLLVELFGLWMALLRHNWGIGINFNLFFNRKRPK